MCTPLPACRLTQDLEGLGTRSAAEAATLQAEIARLQADLARSLEQLGLAQDAAAGDSQAAAAASAAARAELLQLQQCVADGQKELRDCQARLEKTQTVGGVGWL